MAGNRKCPKCGSTHVQLSFEKKRHGCLWTVLFGVYYILWVTVRWWIGCMLFLFWDWWMAIVKACLGKGHVWQCRKWFSGRKQFYYCHACGYNFKA